MPKKTKRQKILAELHRRLQYSQNLQTQDLKLNSEFVKSQNEVATQSKEPQYSTTLNYAKHPFIKPKNANIPSSYAFVKNDLIRITIFTAFALALQGVLYFLIRTK